ncbi:MULTISPECIES: helix-turn-helix domain-containing protein [Streptomyces]|uniref:helix-turn-helix domain-containing protein n=1 Tax=Streptomyces TaxID=1883 RepID=UPI0022494315|nr:helix-turn-helix transcriptional regulator [Streptomyces sp. JHD 1]MCX2971143.1 helix-turn-helix transcriptional regulator [Streptomyces sp. JHD 1]
MPTTLPLELPPRVWDDAAMREALRARDIGAVFRGCQRYGVSQTRLATATGMTQARVSEVIRGRREVEQFAVIERIAGGLAMPDDARRLLGLAPARERRTAPEPAAFELAAFPEILRVYPRQAGAAEEIQRAAVAAREIDVLAVRGLGLLALNDSLLRASLPHSHGGLGLRLRVLLLHPEADAVEQRAAEIGESASALAAGIKLATERLAELADSGRDVHVFWYRMLPTWRVIRIDDVLFAGTFTPGWEGHESAMYKVTRTESGPLFSGLGRQVEALLAESHCAV